MAKKLNQRKGVYFWAYDSFPYLLWGEGTMRADGRVEIRSYGPGYSFKPVLWFPNKRAAQQLIDRLYDLERFRENALKLVHDGADRRRNELLDELATQQNKIQYVPSPAS